MNQPLKKPSMRASRLSRPSWICAGSLLLLTSCAHPTTEDHVPSPMKESARESAVSTGLSAEGAAINAEPIEFPLEQWQAAGVKVTSVISQPMHDVVELTGKIALNEDRLAHIFPLVEGRVDRVNIQFGQQVRRGELLLVVQSKEVGQGMLQLFQDRHQLELAEIHNQWAQQVAKNTLELIEMLRSRASVESIEKTFTERTIGEYRDDLMKAYLNQMHAKAQYERLAPLSDSGAVPARQILEAEIELKSASASLLSCLEQTSQDVLLAARETDHRVKELETNIAVTATNLKILGFQDKDLEHIDPSTQGEQLAHYPIQAPFDGTIISKDVVLMERVGPESQILTIADLSTVWVLADIYESHLPLLTRMSDQTLKLRCAAWPNREFQARVFYTGDVVREDSRTIALRGLAENKEGLLKPGMFVTVELPGSNLASVPQVPLTAIQEYQGQSFVFVQTGDEHFQRRDVTTGRRTSSMIEVISGLQAGDRVATSGGFALKSKMLADLLSED